MGSAVSDVGGILTGGTSTLQNALGQVSQPLSQYTTPMAGLAGNYGNIASSQYGTGQSLIGTGLNQYQMGAQGQLTPGMQQIVNNAQQQGDVLTNAGYARMGLGGSTMNEQDLGNVANQAAQLQANLANQEQSLGLQASQYGLGALSGAAGTTVDEGNLYNQLANLQLTQNSQIASVLNQLAQAQTGQQSNLINAFTNLGSSALNATGLGSSGTSTGAVSGDQNFSSDTISASSPPAL